MMKKWFKILPIVFLLTAQIIVAAHIHSPDEAVAEQGCIYCQTAAGPAVVWAISLMMPVCLMNKRKQNV